MLPLAVPGLVLAFGYLAMSQDGKFFSFLNPRATRPSSLSSPTPSAACPTSCAPRSPAFSRPARPSKKPRKTSAARPSNRSIKITLPLIAANLIAGGLLAFAFAMLEVSDSLILAQKQLYYPITKAIMELFQFLGDGKFIASALGVWAMVFFGVTIVGLSLLLGKKLGAIFRV
jgi:iron(III) transport system permease protein